MKVRSAWGGVLWLVFRRLVFAAALLQATRMLADDEVELLSGTRIQGKILDRTEQAVRIRATVENRSLIRSYPINRVRSITHNGKRELLSADAKEAAAGSATNSAPVIPTSGDSAMVQRTASAIDSMIEQAGQNQPDWLASTALEFPKTLDLSWPEPTPVVWNYTRNVDHYLWDVINSNPGRYRSGVRLMHHLLATNQNNPRTRARALNELGRMYFEFFKDYAHAAYYWRQAKVDQDPKFKETASPARLAECYWKLGNRAMAEELLGRIPLTLASIKLWGDLKQTEKALQLCQEALKRGFLPSQTYLTAGDVCRTAKDFTRAVEYYQKVLSTPVTPAQSQQIKRDQDRARAIVEVIRLFDVVDPNKIPDGAYTGKSLGYGGDIVVEVAVKGRRIDSIKVLQNSDRQYYRSVEDTIQRIIARQTVSGIDAISGATFTSEALVRASAKALGDGMNSSSATK